MPAIFSKNCILRGDLDSYCLVCSTNLCGEEEILAHIQNSNHNTSLKPIAYHDKFKDDFIRKVKGVYFCELCNKTYTTAAKVGIHVAEETHVKRRRIQMRRIGTSIVFQKNTLIEERAWNGLVDETCVVCNTDFDDYSTHLSEQTHILNVIRSTVTVDSNDNIYRNVEGGYHCLTCNEIVSDNCITEHLKSTKHNGAVVKEDLIQYTDSDPITAEENVEKKNKKGGQSDVVVKDPETKPSKKCTIDGKSSNSGPPLIKGKDKQTPSKSITKEVEIFAKQHGLTVNEFNNTVHCAVCILQVPAMMNCVKEHILGKKHKENSLKNSITHEHTKKKFKKIKSRDFITEVGLLINLQGNFFVINEKFCLKVGDFFGFSVFNNKLTCEFCQIDLNLENMDAHRMSTPHINLLDKSYVVTSLENEFVRQVKSDLYHCGYCGIVETDFDEMLDHLETTRHKMRRAESEMIIKRIEF